MSSTKNRHIPLVSYGIIITLTFLGFHTHAYAQERTETILVNSSTSGVVMKEQLLFLGEDEVKQIRMIEKAKKAVVNVVGASTKEELSLYLTTIATKASSTPTTSALPQLASTEDTESRVTQGTGFFVESRGKIMTNKHVVENPHLFYGVVTSSGKVYHVKAIFKDPLNDVALIDLDLQRKENFPILEFTKESSFAKIGQKSFTIGNALGQYVFSVSQGIVSGVGRTLTAYGENNSSERLYDMVQTDASISQGNSGGPLIDSTGKVLGMNTAFEPRGMTIGFAIHAKYLQKVLESFLIYGYIPKPFLGIHYIHLTPSLAKDLELSTYRGAYIRAEEGTSSVVAGSPAEKAGLRNKDIILNVNGEAIKGERTLSDILSLYRNEETIRLLVQREGKNIQLQATLLNKQE